MPDSIWSLEDERAFQSLALRRARFDKIREDRLVAALRNLKFPSPLPTTLLVQELTRNAAQLVEALEPYIVRPEPAPDQPVSPPVRG